MRSFQNSTKESGPGIGASMKGKVGTRVSKCVMLSKQHKIWILAIKNFAWKVKVFQDNLIMYEIILMKFQLPR